jgi:RNA polymerase sigma-70 factor (ECF subfamily)
MLSTDSDALAYAFARHRGDVFAFVLSRTRNRYDAEELTQQTFADAVSAFERGGAPRSTRSWLFSVAERRIVDEARRRVRLLDVEVAASRVDPAVDAPVAAAFRRLPARDRQLLFLRIVEERTHAEVAAVLGCSAPAVRMRVSRALRRLRSEIDADV